MVRSNTTKGWIIEMYLDGLSVHEITAIIRADMEDYGYRMKLGEDDVAEVIESYEHEIDLEETDRATWRWVTTGY